MNLSNPLIINSEVFLQCAGNCSGCFLSTDERLSSNFYLDNVKENILTQLSSNPNRTHYVVGFGRGNILNLPVQQLHQLRDFMLEVNESYGASMITFEISTSLIGKIDTQIHKAAILLEKLDNAYFNIVINSEIVSNNFWLNWDLFYKANERLRYKKGFTDNLGDILVLNVNPKSLPDISFLNTYLSELNSPINISLFPFGNSDFNDQDLIRLSDWALEVFMNFKDKDLNIKNVLSLQSSYELDNFSGYIQHSNKNISNYVFIDKNGHTDFGSMSIMGEIDSLRVLNKYNIKSERNNFLKLVSKNASCMECEHQGVCLNTGSYINGYINAKNKDFKLTTCPSGYKKIFDYFSKDSSSS